MNFDGEYRTAFIAADAPGLKYGTAPHPVSKPSLHGSGFVIGTIMGIPRALTTRTKPGSSSSTWRRIRRR